MKCLIKYLFFVNLVLFANHASIAQIGKGLVLDGCNNFLEINENDLLDKGNVLSIEAWIRPNCDDQNRVIISKEWCQGEFSYYLSVKEGKLNWRYSVDGDCVPDSEGFNSMNVVIPIDLFTHVAVVHSQNSIQLFVNGNKIGGVHITGFFDSIYNSDEPLRIGCYKYFGGSFGNFFSGMIDELRLWNVELNETLIQQRMNTPLVGNEPGLVLYHDMEETGEGQSLVLKNQSNYSALFDAITVGFSEKTPYTQDINSYENITLLKDVTTNCSDNSLTVSLESQRIIKDVLWNTSETTHSIQVSQVGTYTVQVETEACKIIHDTVVLKKNRVSMLPEYYSICNGQSIHLYGRTFSTPGNYTGLKEGNFCDTLYDVTISTGDTDSTTIYLEICEGDFTYIYGQSVFPGNSIVFTFQGADGCDSVEVWNVGLLPTSQRTISLGTCGKDYTYFEDHLLKADNTYSFTYPNSNSCDSILTVHVKKTPVHLDETYKTFRACGSISFQDSILHPNTTHSFHLVNQFGCDSTIHINVEHIGCIKN